MADDPNLPRRRVTQVRKPKHMMAGVVLLLLDESLPAGVRPAPLRCPHPTSVLNKSWWVFGFPSSSPRGRSANGMIREQLAYGWLRLDGDTTHLAEIGFAGAGLWCPDYEAVVAVVGRATGQGDIHAISLYHVDQYFPGEDINALGRWVTAAAGEVAHAAWGWTLTADPEADRHWEPRARGVSIAAERGHRFCGRRAALKEIIGWLERGLIDRKVLVVTGSPGVGKSAVLGRIITTADLHSRGQLPANDDVPRAPVGSVACAIHAKGKTALDVAREIARAASAPLPDRVEDLPRVLRDRLAALGRARFNLIIDALDEAAEPRDTRLIISGIVMPISDSCADVGAQMIVGTRRYDEGGDLLQIFGYACTTINLDQSSYFALEDLANYAPATLQLRGDERPANPYRADEVASPVAMRIAELAEGNFLVAGLVARTHGLYDVAPVRPDAVSFSSSVEAALTTYLDRIAPLGRLSSRELLMPLSFAQAPGLPVELWQVAVRALAEADITREQLRRFANGSAANFLVESGSATPEPVFRLFHQALADELSAHGCNNLPSLACETALTNAFLMHGTAVGWDRAAEYLFRSLPAHALRAGLIDRLLADVAYIMRADLRRLIPAADQAATAKGVEAANIMRLTPRAIPAPPAERLALLSITEALDGSVESFRSHPEGAVYRGGWARTRRRLERAVLEGHTDWVLDACSLNNRGHALLASGGADGTVRLWDPFTGAAERTISGHTDWVTGVCAVRLNDRELLASVSADSSVRLWDTTNGYSVATLLGHESVVRAVCTVDVASRRMLVTCGDDRTVRFWDLDTGTTVRTLMCTAEVLITQGLELDGRAAVAVGGTDGTISLWDSASGTLVRVLKSGEGAVRALRTVRDASRLLLAAGGDDQTVQIWDPRSGVLLRTFRGHSDVVNGLAVVNFGGREVLASGSADSTARLWDVESGAVVHVLGGHADSITSMTVVGVHRRRLLVSTSQDGTVRLWDPATGIAERTLEGYGGGVRGVAGIEVERQQVVISADSDTTVRLWDAATGNLQGTLEGLVDWVNGACAVYVGGRALVASASDDETVRVWKASSGSLVHTLHGHSNWVNCVTSFRMSGEEMLASGGADGTVRLWNPANGEHLRTLQGHTGAVRSVCAIDVAAGNELLASGSNDRTVKLWDPLTGELKHTLEGHSGGVRAVCAVGVDGVQLLASASNDQTLRLWNPADGTLQRILTGHTRWVRGVCTLRYRGRRALASASHDRTVRIWDPATGALWCEIPVHHEALAVWSFAANRLVVGLAAGLLTINLD